MPVLNSSQLLQLAQGAGFQGNDAQTMAAIMKAESGGRTDAHNPNASTGDNSYGLAQVNMYGGLGPARLKQFGLKNNAQLLDPQTNLRAAKQIRDSSGFGAWSTYKSGAYKQFLPEVQKAAAGLPTNPPTTQGAQQTSSGNTYNIYMSGENQEAKDWLTSTFLPKLLNKPEETQPAFNPLSLLTQAFNTGSSLGEA